MKTLYLDIFSGISGDMFVGAMIDLGVDAGALEHEMGKLKLDGWHVHVARQQRAGVDGVKFDVHVEHGHSHEHTHADGTTHTHPHSHAHESKQHHEHTHDDHQHGAHGGLWVGTSRGRVELSVFEMNVPPRFRLYFYDARGKAVRPPAASTVSLETVRPDKARQSFKFKGQGEYLEAIELLPEPHEFRAKLKLKRGSRIEKHETRFVEDHHAHHGDKAQTHDGHEHVHEPGRNFAEIRELIRRSALSDWVKQRAIAVFQRVARAEGKVHGLRPERVHFHEVGAVDSIVDIVGACIALERLGRPRVLAGPVIEGRGWIDCAHGRFPVPAPATLEILAARGVPLAQCDEPHELVTPTGAALLAEFAESFGPMPGMVLTKIGYGLGTRDHQSRPNVLRAVLGEVREESRVEGRKPRAGREDHDWETDTIAVIETNLDDINAEILGHFVEQAFGAGALDVFHTPIQMKKNRPGVLLTVLCATADADKFIEMILRETSAFGVRRYAAERRKLRRELIEVKTPYGGVTVKIGRLNGRVVQTTPEYESCRKLASKAGVPVKQIYEAAIQAGGQVE